MNEVMTQAAPTFEAAWSRDETEPVQDYREPRSRATTVLLVVFVGILAAVTMWFVFRLMTTTEQVATQPVLLPATTVPLAAEPSPPTFAMPELPTVDAIDQDSRYINLLRNRGVVVNDKASGVQSAHMLCQAKQDGYTTQQMISAVLQVNPQLATRLAPVVVDTAIETYCHA